MQEGPNKISMPSEKKEETFGEKASRVLGYVKRDLANEAEWLGKSPEAQMEEISKEKKEKEEAEAKAAEDEQKEKEKADQEEKMEEKRIDNVKKSYIVHTAQTKCSMGLRISFVIIPKGHGEFIHGMPQLNIGDSAPITNIRVFGGCHSPKNPSVQDAAKEVLKKVDENHQSFIDKVNNFFCGKPKDVVGDDLASKCAGECTPIIDTEWIDGQEDVLIEGKPALLGRCKLNCLYGGEITLFTSGQPEE
ncbi:DUF4280 domain-containing protein [uncultured Clostridium sp.]|uniref:DUF4280 domain-containing protein n=1 Tax=uncultured Clostridium sp. TaxID=59620 RepID=UPI0028F14755|nr:DUF4280 domain-containing protein [uncultured Clostridium sp.]